jgi:Domain of unknown function (DUF4166)/Saccharopine dehydrogenase NADP binding domain
LKILIIGGYGTFGGRTIQLLKSEASLRLIVAGRSLSKAHSFCELHADAKANLEPALFDRDNNVLAQLKLLGPDWVVDASGPFQNYGSNAYDVIKACIDRGIHYLDLADGSEFVEGVHAFDAQAKAANVFVLSGVSSFPVLTAAVVRRLEKDVPQIESIHAGIAPSPYAGVGLNVIRAIAGYAGQPTRLKRNGAFVNAYPFTESMLFTVAVPGYRPLRQIRFSLVDVPDLQALTQLWPNARHVWMGAGPLPALLHHMLILLAWCVRWRLLPSLLPLAPIISWVTNNIRWGEHRGGMFVQIEGRDSYGNACQSQWHLLAEGSDGPMIPSMAVQALILRALMGVFPERGARAAVRDLELSDYEPLFISRTLFTGLRRLPDNGSTSIFERALGSSWNTLATAVKELHSSPNLAVYTGLCCVQGATGMLAKFIAMLIGFPRSGENLPIQFNIEKELTKNGQMTERWTRKIGTQSFSSILSAGQGVWEHLLVERFGLAKFALAAVRKNEGLELMIRHWSLLRVPMPMWLAPRATAIETSRDGRFNFAISLSHPCIGLIVKYHGWLIKSDDCSTT